MKTVNSKIDLAYIFDRKFFEVDVFFGASYRHPNVTLSSKPLFYVVSTAFIVTKRKHQCDRCGQFSRGGTPKLLKGSVPTESFTGIFNAFYLKVLL